MRDALYTRLLDECEERLQSGRAVGSYMETVLNNQVDLEMTRENFGISLLPFVSVANQS